MKLYPAAMSGFLYKKASTNVVEAKLESELTDKTSRPSESMAGHLHGERFFSQDWDASHS